MPEEDARPREGHGNRRLSTHVDRRFDRREGRRRRPQREDGRPEREVDDARRARRPLRDELDPPGRVRRLVGRHGRSPDRGASAHDRHREDLRVRRRHVLSEAKVNRLRGRPIEADGRRRRAAVPTGPVHGDRVARGRRLVEDVGATAIRRGRHRRHDPVDVDQGDGRGVDEGERPTARTDDPDDLGSPPGRQRDERGDAEEQDEEDCE